MNQRRKKNSICVFTVIYPGAERFLDAYFHSLSIQTRNDFDVLLINDEMKGVDCFVQKYGNLSIAITDIHDSPVKIREYGLNAIARCGYEDIIFGDADDYFDKRRIELVTEYLCSYQIVVNELNVVDTLSNPVESRYLSRRISPLSLVNADDVVHMNFLGFSNTAMKAHLLEGNIRFPKDIIALDWYFFASLLMRGANAFFINDTCTYYRSHGDNMASFMGDEEWRILQGVKAKTAHYRAMASQGESYVRLKSEFETLVDRFERDSCFRLQYVKCVRDRLTKNGLWWETIRSPGEIGL